MQQKNDKDLSNIHFSICFFSLLLNFPENKQPNTLNFIKITSQVKIFLEFQAAACLHNKTHPTLICPPQTSHSQMRYKNIFSVITP